MTRTCSLLLASALSASAQATIPHGEHAPLSQHLTEVNACWNDHPWAFLDVSTNFHDDDARIAQHLFLVRDALLRDRPAGFAAEVFEHRDMLLHRLGDYAATGVFPRNQLLPARHPVFIDPLGTACAVGWLMIESGHRDLAERISSEMNLAYVMDMPASPLWPEITAWAGAHGFTPDELAWIQPGYPPAIPTFPWGGGTNGPVKAIAMRPNEHVVIAGDFTEAGGNAAARVAVWNDMAFVPVGTGIVNGSPECALAMGNDIWLGGRFLDGEADLAHWNGSTWQYELVFNGMDPAIHALHWFDGTLHVAGESTGFANTTHAVMRQDGDSWNPVGSPFNDAVLTLTTFDGALVAGGAFTQPVSIIDPLMLYVAKYDGVDWHQYADGLDATVHALLAVDGKLYAGGDIKVLGESTFGLARIGANDMAWETLIGPEFFDVDPGQAHIASIARRADELILGGSFGVGDMMVMGTHLAMYHMPTGAVTPGIFHNAPVEAVFEKNGMIYYGGLFTSSNMGQLPHAAITDFTTGMPVTDPFPEVTLLPNPVRDDLMILAEGLTVAVPLRLTDMAGRSVELPTTRIDGGLRLDVRPLAAGTYLITLPHHGVAVPLRFVKN
ncbi:MAG: T9SS type A sorting domain-containing protein [Flavobacteriales bacterium]|nr:T9SS type A sorting domain-containing protein [Flavobacteriales bacterium]